MTRKTRKKQAEQKTRQPELPTGLEPVGESWPRYLVSSDPETDELVLWRQTSERGRPRETGSRLHPAKLWPEQAVLDLLERENERKLLLWALEKVSHLLLVDEKEAFEQIIREYDAGRESLGTIGVEPRGPYFRRWRSKPNESPEPVPATRHLGAQTKQARRQVALAVDAAYLRNWCGFVEHVASALALERHDAELGPQIEEAGRRYSWEVPETLRRAAQEIFDDSTRRERAKISRRLRPLRRALGAAWGLLEDARSTRELDDAKAKDWAIRAFIASARSDDSVDRSLRWDLRCEERLPSGGTVWIARRSAQLSERLLAAAPPGWEEEIECWLRDDGEIDTAVAEIFGSKPEWLVECWNPSSMCSGLWGLVMFTSLGTTYVMYQHADEYGTDYDIVGAWEPSDDPETRSAAFVAIYRRLWSDLFLPPQMGECAKGPDDLMPLAVSAALEEEPHYWDDVREAVKRELEQMEWFEEAGFRERLGATQEEWLRLVKLVEGQGDCQGLPAGERSLLVAAFVQAIAFEWP